MQVFGWLLALLTVAPLTAHMQDSGGSAAGLWLSETRSDGGLGSWVQLRDDGTASLGFGALIEGTYTMEGASLRRAFPRGVEKDASSESSVVEMRIDGNTAMRTQPPPAGWPPQERLTPEDKAMFDRLAQPLRMTRVGAPAPDAPSIVGTWSYTHYTGAKAYELYTPSGAMVLMVEMQVQQATYSGQGDTLELRLPGATAKMVVRGDALTLTSSDGETTTYRRAPR
jgi:hypothetical protein